MAGPNASMENTITNSPRLLDQVRDKLRVKHYSIRTELLPVSKTLSIVVSNEIGGGRWYAGVSAESTSLRQ